jgi:hypothetical protein
MQTYEDFRLEETFDASWDRWELADLLLAEAGCVRLGESNDLGARRSDRCLARELSSEGLLVKNPILLIERLRLRSR